MDKNVKVIHLVISVLSLTLLMIASIVNFHLKVGSNAKDVDYVRNREIPQLEKQIQEVKGNYKNLELKIEGIDKKATEILVQLQNKENRK